MIDWKFKEERPIQTISRIRNALLDAGIFTVESWTDSEIEGCYSVRVEIAGTKIGQNGKGVTREFALASGYAELMERIQSGYFYVGAMDEELQKECGFIYAPEEKEFTVKEYAEQYGDLIHPLKSRMQNADMLKVEDILENCRYGETIDSEKDFSALPFTSIKNDKTVYFPVPLLLDVYATNGTCAGNTKREAVIQGLSEIIERNHNLKVLAGAMTPPDIPEDYLKQFPVYSVIQEIRKDDNYTLIVKDCSLGTGFPVIASILANKKSHKYIVKFGAHPVFEIALERTLTEMLQGRKIEDAANTSTSADSIQEIRMYDNMHNVLKNASGKYHYKLFGKIPDREFVPFPDRTEMDNQQLYDYCMQIFTERGYEIYIRDCSFLGFPTFQIIIPGFSEIYNYGISRLREKNSQKLAGKTLCELDTASEHQIESLFLYMRFKENFSMENTLSFTLRQPLLMNSEDDVLAFFQIEMCLAIRLKKWKEVIWCTQVLKEIDSVNSEWYLAVREMAGRILSGCENLEAFESIQLFYEKQILKKVEKIWNWEICAREIAGACKTLLFQRENSAYEIYRSVKRKLKEIQENWYESGNCAQI